MENLSSIFSMSSLFTWGNIINFKIILLSIVIEALPFVLLSVIVSAILHNFVADDLIGRIMPKNKLSGIVTASLLGILFPVCDCGMVPIMRRLVMKGVPLPTAVSFMLGAPILNPVVASATAFAFKTNPNMVWLRLGTAFAVACLAGWLTSLVFKGNELKTSAVNTPCACGCANRHGDDYPATNTTFAAKIVSTIHDASNEFFEMGKYLLIGAMLGAVAQIMLPRAFLTSVGQHPVFSIGGMMLFAFVVSVCSAADAFIAASFYTSFSAGSLIAFMVLGPMVDLKNTLMLLHAFRFRLVLWLVFIVAALCTVAAYSINLF